MNDWYECSGHEDLGCGEDLRRYLWDKRSVPFYCPRCGRELDKELRDRLWQLTTDAEITDMIREHLLEALDCADESTTLEDLARLAWESEMANGVTFCSNYEADLFYQRHYRWMDVGYDEIEERVGKDTPLRQHGNEDTALVWMFLWATEAYLTVDCGHADICARIGSLGFKDKDVKKSPLDKLRAEIAAVEYGGRF